MEQDLVKRLLNEGNTSYQQMQENKKVLAKKWEQSGLLEGIDDPYERQNMATLLENQAKQIVFESSRTGNTTNSEQWAGVALPLVRRIFGEISVKDFVSIQPMNLPSGLIFYLDFRYGSGNQAGFTINNSLYGGSGAKFGTTDSASGGLYGAGRFGYSKAQRSAAVTGPAATGAVEWHHVDFDPDLSASAAAGTLARVFITGSDLTRPDYEAVKGFEISGTVGQINAYYPLHTYRTNANQVVFVVGKQTGISTTGSFNVTYYEQTVASARGDFEDTTTSGSAVTLNIPEVDIQLRSIEITSNTRKLKGVWTPEFAQDINAYHSLDAEALLSGVLSEYVSTEIDLEILEMLVLNAQTTEVWSANPGWEFRNTDNTFYSAGSHTGTKNEWYETLGNKIKKVSNQIHQKTLRGGANFLVCSPTVATVLESIEGYTADNSIDVMGSDSFAMGVRKVGMFNSQIRVFKNPYWTSNIILIGFRGDNFLATGAVYSPYIPLIMSPIVYDPNNFTPRQMVFTRYAKKLLRGEYYGRIAVHGLETV